MAEDYYSSIAAGYDELHGAEQDEKLAEFLARVHLRENITLLDVGCGTGRSAMALDNLNWYGIDPSPGLLAQATPYAKRKMRQAAAEAIPFPDASFDVILSLTALQNFTNPQQGLREIKRVAKPGALILISFLKKSPKATDLQELITKELVIVEAWEQTKDYMYICKA